MKPEFHPREFKASVGTLQLMALRVAYTYAGMLEGSPHTSRTLHVRRLEDELATRERGLIVIGLDLLRTEVEKRVERWLPSEWVRADLRSFWTPPGTHPTGLHRSR